MKNSISKLNMSYKEWLNKRSESIGASDAGVILGVNPWKTKVDLYYEKINNTIDTSDNISMRLGRDLEPVIRELFTEETGLKVRVDNKIRFDKHHHFISTNLDGMVVGEKVPIELKTAAEWRGEIPDHYFLQIQHQMMVTKAPYIYFVVLVLGWGKRLIIEKYDRNEKVIDHLRMAEIDFWYNNIIPKHPPQPVNTSDAQQPYPYNNDKIIDVPNDKTDIEMFHYKKLTESMKELKENIDKSKLKLMKVIKENDGISRTDDTIPITITWKKSKDRYVFNTKKFKKEQPELYKEYITLKEGSRRFVLKKEI